MQVESIVIGADDGTRLHVQLQRHSDSSRPTCLLLHGYGDGAYVWADTCAALLGTCTTAAVDLRGHGDSEPSRSGAYDVATSVRDVSTIISALGLTSVIPIGHSFGGEIVLRLAAQAVTAIPAAIFVDICPQPDQGAARHATALLRQTLRTYGSIEEYCEALLCMRPILSRAAAEHLARGCLRPTDSGFQPKLAPALVDHADDEFTTSEQWQALLPRIRCPVLIVRGAASAMVTAACAVQMARLLAQARVVTVPKAGHAVMSDNPGAFSAEVLGFINSIAPAPDCSA